jgi:hypothetical protein
MLEKDQELISTLELLLEAYKLGFSTFSSPVNSLLRIMIDLSLKLRNLFQEGGQRWDHPANKSIRFMDGINSPWIPDALGNPRQISQGTFQKQAEDPLLSQFFEKIALDLVQIKRLQSLPENLYSSDETKKPKKKIKPESYHFFRRTREKRR